MTFDIFGIASNHKLVIENDELFIVSEKEKVKVSPNSLRIHVYGLDKENDDKLNSIKNGSITVCECIPGIKNFRS